MKLILERRDWIKASSLLALSFLTGRRLVGATRSGRDSPYLSGQVLETQAVPLPAGKHIPFGWKHATLTRDRPVEVSWDTPGELRGRDVLFRVTSATDIRENVSVRVRLAGSQRVLGHIDMRYAHLMQPFELKIGRADVPALLTEGVDLTLQGGAGPVWIFGGSDAGGTPPAYLPHLLAKDGRDGQRSWEDRLFSLESIQRFGWMEGTTMDGLYAAAVAGKGLVEAKRLARKHWELFVDEPGRLRFVGIRNGRYDISHVGGEDPLPFATLAKVWPECPVMADAIAYFEKIARPDRTVSRWLSTEGAYTMCYPMAVFAKVVDRPHLARACVDGLLARRRFLVEGGSIYRSGNREEGTKGFGNWARGAAWYVLGFERALEYLPARQPGRDELIAGLGEGMEMCFRHRRPDGLWTCFMDEPGTGIDTSGSAGIAAAAALGAKHGFLERRYRFLAGESFETLTRRWLAPDGYLRGSAQENKGGRELQVEGFRGISPYTLGLLGLLQAGLT